jgi:hypothetical protein
MFHLVKFKKFSIAFAFFFFSSIHSSWAEGFPSVPTTEVALPGEQYVRNDHIDSPSIKIKENVPILDHKLFDNRNGKSADVVGWAKDGAFELSNEGYYVNVKTRNEVPLHMKLRFLLPTNNEKNETE